MTARALRRPTRLADLFPEQRLKEVTALLGTDNEAVQSLHNLLREEQTLTPGGTGGGLERPVSSRSQKKPATHKTPDGHTGTSPDLPDDREPPTPGSNGVSGTHRPRGDRADQREDTATSRTPTPCHPTASKSQCDNSLPPQAQKTATPPTASDIPPLVLPQTLRSLPMCDEELLMPGQVPSHRPFPVKYLPEPIQRFVTQQAQSLNCDAASIALPVLSVLASALGGNKRIELKPGHAEPAILWTAVVREAMASHDPVLEAAIAPLRQRQALAFQQQQQLMLEYRHRLAAFRANQRRDPDGSYPPVEPLAERTMTVDWTLPTLNRLLTKQSRGLLICPLELDGWLHKSTTNSARAAVERQAWFDLHVGRSVMIEGRTSVQLSAASVSLTGSLSAEVLSHRLTKSPVACGLTGRLLLAAPPAQPICWTNDEVDQATLADYDTTIDKLFSLSSPDQVPSGAGCVTLSTEASSAFAEFIADLGAQQEQIDDALFAWTSNLPSQAARLALVLHETRWAAKEDVDPHVCDQHSMRCGIALARWFAYEAQRVLKKLSLTAERRDLLRLYEWIERRKNPASVRDVCRHNSRKYPTAELAMNALNTLAATGVTRWANSATGPHGGRPTQKMELTASDEQKVTSDEEEQLCHTEPRHNATSKKESHAPDTSAHSVHADPEPLRPSMNDKSACCRSTDEPPAITATKG